MSESSHSSPQGRPLPDTPTGNRGAHTLRQGPWRLTIFAAALLVAIFVGMTILPYALELPASVVFPLALIIATLFAAIGASWVGTYFAPDSTRTRLLPVVGISMATAALIALIVSVGGALVSQQMLRTPVIMTILATLDMLILLVPVLAIVLSVSWATWHFRGPRGPMGWDAKLTLALALVVFSARQLAEFVLSFLAMFGVLSDRVLNFVLGYMMLDRVYVYLLGVSVADWVSIASVALGLVLALWRFRRRGDWLGVDAAITLCLVALAPLIISVVDILYGHGFFNGLY